MRRADRGAAAAPESVAGKAEAKPRGVLAFNGLRLDLVKRELVQPKVGVVPLTTGEFELLRVFASHPNRVLSRNQLMDLAKGREWAAYDRAVDTQVARLRKKIERDLASPKIIKTVRGVGYVFAAVVEAE